MTVTLIATTTMGFESTLAHEIRALGFENVRVSDTKVEFDGTIKDICRANLWLRTAGRVYVKLSEFNATTFDELFEKTRAIDWSQWLPEDAEFPVAQVSSRKSKLFSKSDCQSIVKKAIAECLKTAHNAQNLPETGELFPIRIQIENDTVILSIDSSGTGLNKRGYRAHMDTAPLRETLAAGLVLLSRWRPDKDVLMDPFCGTGTILIEAGLIAHNIAPGLNRGFCSEYWPVVGEKRWESARTEANDLIRKDAAPPIYGSDNSAKALTIARKNIELAGLRNVHIQNRNIYEISSRFDCGKLICNPPYGERMAEKSDAEILYKNMGKVFRKNLPQWSYYILCPHEKFDSLFGQKATKRRKVFNGGMQCWFQQYHN